MLIDARNVQYGELLSSCYCCRLPVQSTDVDDEREDDLPPPYTARPEICPPACPKSKLYHSPDVFHDFDRRAIKVCRFLYLSSAPARQQSIDISCSPGPQQQTRRTLLQQANGTDKQTDRQADGRTPYRFIDPTMRAVPIIIMTLLYVPCQLNLPAKVLTQTKFTTTAGITQHARSVCRIKGRFLYVLSLVCIPPSVRLSVHHTHGNSFTAILRLICVEKWMILLLPACSYSNVCPSSAHSCTGND